MKKKEFKWVREEAQEKLHTQWFGKGNNCPNRCSVCIRLYGEKEMPK